MTKQDQAQYLVNLIAIMESKESAGNARGTTLAKEYTLTYDAFTTSLRKEHDETGKRVIYPHGSNETRTQEPRNQSGLRGPDRDSTRSRESD